MDAYETIERDGYTIAIRWDEDSEHANPRQWDNLGTMVCWHPDYVLGDYQFTNPDGRGAIGGGENRRRYRDGEWQPFTTPSTRFERDDFKSMRHLERYLGIALKAVGILPLYLYDHSGISMSAGSRNPFDYGGWDTTSCGFIYTTHERITELCGDGAEYHADDKIIEMMRGEVGEYDKYITGDVWYFTIEYRGETIESCGGFLGIEHCRNEAQEVVNGLVRARMATIEQGMRQWQYVAALAARAQA